jgi:Repeats of unknown function (DUF5649)
VLGTLETGGKLVAGAGGSITQNGAVQIGGTTSLTGAAITLDRAGNNFAGVVDIDGLAVRIAAQSNLRLGDVDAQSLTVSSQGDLNLGTGTVRNGLVASAANIEQSGALNVSGTASIDVGAGTVRLEDAGNQFNGPVSLRGGDSRLLNATSLRASLNTSGPVTA